MNDPEEEAMLNSFRGLPAHLKTGKRDRAKTVDSWISGILKKYQIEEPRIEQLIIQNWRDIVGHQNAHRCKPQRLAKDGVLIITTTNSTLRMELQFSVADILKRIHTTCGSDQVKQVVIR